MYRRNALFALATIPVVARMPSFTWRLSALRLDVYSYPFFTADAAEKMQKISAASAVKS